LPYTKPHPEVAVVSAVTPSGGRLAGKYDLSMICVAATNPFGYDALASNWQIACDVAAEHGRTMDPNRLRLVGPMHIAETRQKAFENARWGFERYLGYLNNNQPRFIVPKGDDPLEWFVENKYGVCGTPDDAIALIERLQTKQGEFGVFLQQAHNWADFEATKRSYELYARYVMPHFSRANAPRAASYQWCGDNRTEFSAKRNAAAKAGSSFIDIAADGENSIYSNDSGERDRAIAFGKAWIDVAARLGSPSVRINIAAAKNARPEVARVAEGLKPIAEQLGERFQRASKPKADAAPKP